MIFERFIFLSYIINLVEHIRIIFVSSCWNHVLDAFVYRQWRKYKIVEFDEGIEMIPITWLNRDRTITYWPPQNQIKINKAISSMEPPKENWKKCKIKKIIAQAGRLKQIMRTALYMQVQWFKINIQTLKLFYVYIPM